jgi:hypothetical protein
MNYQNYPVAIGGAIVVCGLVVNLAGCGRVSESTPNNAASSTTSSSEQEPVETPDEIFVDRMNSVFGYRVNRGRDPISDFGNYRFFTSKVVKTGYEICGYLETHSSEEAARKFKFLLPLAQSHRPGR